MRPVHPIFVHFPLALLPLSVAADAAGFFTGIASLAHAGAWAIVAAGAAAVATVATGWFDMRRAPLSEAVHHRVHRHRAVGLVLGTAIVGLAAWRGWLFARGQALPMAYLDVGVLAIALAAFQGWLGGELVYGDGVFVRPPDAAANDAEETAASDPPAKGGHHH